MDFSNIEKNETQPRKYIDMKSPQFTSPEYSPKGTLKPNEGNFKFESVYETAVGFFDKKHMEKQSEKVYVGYTDFDCDVYYKYTDTISSYCILFCEIKHLELYNKIWMILLCIFNVYCSAFIISSFQEFLIFERDKQIQFFDGDNYYIMSPSLSVYDNVTSSVFSSELKPIVNEGWYNYTNRLKSIFEYTPKSFENILVTYTISSYDLELLIIVCLGGVIIIAKIIVKINECVNLIRIMICREWGIYFNIFVSIIALIDICLIMCTYYITILFCENIVNIQDAFLKVAACFLILEINASIFLVNKYLFQKRVIQKIDYLKLNEPLKYHNYDSSHMRIIYIMEYMLMMYVILLPMIKFYFKANALYEPMLTPPYFYKPFRYDSSH